MLTDRLSVELFLAALRCRAHRWRPEHVVPIALDFGGAYRPRVKA